MRYSILTTVLLLAGGSASVSADAPKRATDTPAKLDVHSSAFKNNEAIPSDYTCEGTDATPPLSWSKVPSGTKSFAILVEDRDAPKGVFTHWLVTGIPASTTSVVGGALPAGAIAAKNDIGSSGYTGPCPPSGRHHYQFHVYALDIAVPSASSRTELLSMMKGHILATGEIVGTYEKKATR